MNGFVSTPLVSVIIPCYNVEDCVKRALDAVLGQKYKNIELICVDNNSTDRTAIILKEYQDKFPQIKLFSEHNKGACFARNTGLKHANGEWIQFLDADDFIDPEKINHQISLLSDLNKLSSKSFVVGQDTWVLANGQKMTFRSSEEAWVDLIGGRLGDTCANLWNKNLLNEVNGWSVDSLSSQEIDLMFRLLKSGAEAIFDNEDHTIIYQRLKGSISGSDPIKNRLRAIDIRLQIRDYLIQIFKLDNYIEQINLALFNFLKELYFESRTDFEEIYKKVKHSTFKLHRIKSFNFLSRTILFFFGLKGYLRLMNLLTPKRNKN